MIKTGAIAGVGMRAVIRRGCPRAGIMAGVTQCPGKQARVERRFGMAGRAEGWRTGEGVIHMALRAGEVGVRPGQREGG
jgi:hypothetical protein